MTQFMVLLIGLLILLLYATGFIFCVSEVMFQGELEVSKFLLLNAGLFLLEFFLACLCFMFACFFDELKFSVGFGAGLGLLFFLAQMLSQVDEKVEFLKYVTPLTLFMPEGLVKYESHSFMGLGVLLAGAAVFLAVGIMRFKKRDLLL